MMTTLLKFNLNLLLLHLLYFFFTLINLTYLKNVCSIIKHVEPHSHMSLIRNLELTVWCFFLQLGVTLIIIDLSDSSVFHNKPCIVHLVTVQIVIVSMYIFRIESSALHIIYQMTLSIAWKHIPYLSIWQQMPLLVSILKPGREMSRAGHRVTLHPIGTRSMRFVTNSVLKTCRTTKLFLVAIKVFTCISYISC